MSYPPPPPTGPEDSGNTPPPPPPPYGSQPPSYGSQPPSYGGQPPGYPPAGPYGGGYATPASSQKALWAMILGIIGLLCCGFASIAALVLGIQAKKEIAASGGMQTGAGQAQAGFVLGVIGCALWALGIVLYAGLVAVGMSTS